MLGYQLPGCAAREDCDLTPTRPTREAGAEADDAVWRSLLELAAAPREQWQRQSSELAGKDRSAFIDLYLPLCEPAPDGARVLGHLGQSIDGYIATATGDSSFVNDQENIRHLHRLRALHDAVIVGAGTVAADDPRLTTRRVAGQSPVRVVLDPQRKLPESLRVFTDRSTRTLLIVAGATGGPDRHGTAQVLFLPTREGSFDLTALVSRLAGLGLRKLFVEGGGVTVTRFFEAGLLDRLHIAVAPVFIGRGRPGMRIAAADSIDACPRPHHRLFAMGQDVLFDCDLRGDDSGSAEGSGTSAEGTRGNGMSATEPADSEDAIRRIH